PGVRVDQALFRQASFVEHALGNLRRALVAGAALVLVVLVLFLHLRAALVSVVAIPLSLLAAVGVLRALGASLDVMVLGGLAFLLLPTAVRRHPAPPRLVTALRRRYVRVLERVLARPRAMLAASGLLLAAGIALVPLLRAEFLPEFHETNFIMHLYGAPGLG